MSLQPTLNHIYILYSISDYNCNPSMLPLTYYYFIITRTKEICVSKEPVSFILGVPLFSVLCTIVRR